MANQPQHQSNQQNQSNQATNQQAAQQTAAAQSQPQAKPAAPAIPEDVAAELEALRAELAALKSAPPANFLGDANPGSTARPEPDSAFVPRHFTNGTPIFNVNRPTGKNG